MDLSQCEGRILRIARGSGTHPDEVRGLLKLHKHFEKVFGKVGKNMKGEASKVKQLQVHSSACVGCVHLPTCSAWIVCGGAERVLSLFIRGLVVVFGWRVLTDCCIVFCSFCSLSVFLSLCCGAQNRCSV